MEPVSKSIGGIMNPIALVLVRFSIGGLFLLPFCIHEMRKKNMYPNPRDFAMLGAGGLLFIFSNVLAQVAVEHTKASIVAIVFCTNPIFTIPLAMIFLKEKINGKLIACILVCIAGIACFFAAEKDSLSLEGMLFTLLPPIVFAFYNIISKKNMQRWNSGMIVTSLTFLAAGFVPAALCAVVDLDFFSGLSWEIGPQLLYLGLVVAGVGFYVYFRAIHESSAVIASTTFYLKIALAPVVAFLLLGEKIRPWSAVGIVLILCGSVPLMLMKLPRVEPSAAAQRA